jgi:hypothetical protein
MEPFTANRRKTKHKNRAKDFAENSVTFFLRRPYTSEMMNNNSFC